jgi:hypothetical protein
MALKFATDPEAVARPDDRGRITLGREITNGVSKYDIFVNEDTGEVLLRPYKEIPANEAWLYKNETAKKLVTDGLKDAKEGKLVKRDLKSSSWIDEVEDEE